MVRLEVLQSRPATNNNPSPLELSELVQSRGSNVTLHHRLQAGRISSVMILHSAWPSLIPLRRCRVIHQRCHPHIRTLCRQPCTLRWHACFVRCVVLHPVPQNLSLIEIRSRDCRTSPSPSILWLDDPSRRPAPRALAHEQYQRVVLRQ